MEGLYLLAVGFAVGLSGAMIPGPLLVYTVSQSMRRGWKTGIYVIVGHSIVEIAIMLLLLAGLGSMMAHDLFVRAIGLIGGSFLLYTSYRLHKAQWNPREETTPREYGSVTGGILFTLFNPSFPLWWATAGARLLVEGYRVAGTAGALLVFIGHWGADFGYFTLVSALVAKGKEGLLKDNIRIFRDALALILACIGAYFVLAAL